MAIFNGSWMDDVLIGSDLADFIRGFAGHDLLQGGKGNDILLGEQGNDTIEGGRGHDTILGGSGDDELRGGRGDDSVLGGDGNDEVYGGNGDDTVDGGNGNDLLFAGRGNDVMIGGAGDDTFFGSQGGDMMLGGDGYNDTVDYSLSSSAVHVNLQTGYGSYGDAAGDSYSGIEHVIGSAFGDVITGNAARNHLYGGAGNDWLIAGAAGDDLDYDMLDGGHGNDRMFGNADNQVFKASSGHDTVSGGGGEDILDFTASGATAGWMIDMETGFASQSYFTPGGTFLQNSVTFTAMHRIAASSHDDDIWGDDGDNFIEAREGSDFVYGGGGNDTIITGAGDHDIAQGGAGDDILMVTDGGHFYETTGLGGWAELGGGSGADRFVFAFMNAAPQMDRALIVDFDRTEGDKIDIAGYGAEGMVFIGDAGFVGGGITETRATALNKSQTDFLVEVDSNGNGFADLSFEVATTDGLGALGAADFLFG